jgi:hypothetical protein
MGDRVVLNEELDRERRPPVQGIRGHSVQMLVGKPADHCCRRGHVLLDERESRSFVHLRVAARLLAVALVHDGPG